MNCGGVSSPTVVHGSSGNNAAGEMKCGDDGGVGRFEMNVLLRALTIGVEEEVPGEVRSLRVDKLLLPWGIGHIAAGMVFD